MLNRELIVARFGIPTVYQLLEYESASRNWSKADSSSADRAGDDGVSVSPIASRLHNFWIASAGGVSRIGFLVAAAAQLELFGFAGAPVGRELLDIGPPITHPKRLW